MVEKEMDLYGHQERFRFLAGRDEKGNIRKGELEFDEHGNIRLKENGKTIFLRVISHRR